MRVQTEEWRRFIHGVRMYKGKLTYFYNGEILYDDDEEFLVYSEEERQKWQVIIVLPGVEVIPEQTFWRCYNVETVIMSDSVKRIEKWAFSSCCELKFSRLSKTLEYIGVQAFENCSSLTSIFIPDSCTEIDDMAFDGCNKLIILTVPRHTTLGRRWTVISGTALMEAFPFGTIQVDDWIRNINQAQEFALHRECASIEPSQDNIYEIIKQQGLSSIHVKNEIGVTPLEYLRENPYIENRIDQHKMIKRLVLDLMGEMNT